MSTREESSVSAELVRSPALVLTEGAEWTYAACGAAWDNLSDGVRQVHDQVRWMRGFLAHQVDVRYGEGRLQEFAAEKQVAYQTMLNLRTVWRAYAEDPDIPNFPTPVTSWSVYAALAAQDDRAELIASGEISTSAQARLIVAERRSASEMGSAPGVSPPLSGPVILPRPPAGDGDQAHQDDAEPRPARQHRARGKNTAPPSRSPQKPAPGEARRARLYEAHGFRMADAFQGALERMTDNPPLTVDALTRALPGMGTLVLRTERIGKFWKADDLDAWKFLALDVLAELEAANLATETPDGWVTGPKFTAGTPLVVNAKHDSKITVYSAAERKIRDARYELTDFFRQVRAWDEQGIQRLADLLRDAAPDDDALAALVGELAARTQATVEKALAVKGPA